MPDLPTISEAGLSDFVSQTWNSIAAPAGTPDDIVDRLNSEVNAIVQSDAVRTQLIDLGAWASEAHKIPGKHGDDVLSGELDDPEQR